MENEELMSRYLDGDVSELGIATLNHKILSDPAVADRITELALVEYSLKDCPIFTPQLPERKSSGFRPQSHRRRLAISGKWAVAAALALFVGAFALHRQHGLPRTLGDVGAETAVAEGHKVPSPEDSPPPPVEPGHVAADQTLDTALRHYTVAFDPVVVGEVFRPDLITTLSDLQDSYERSRERVRNKGKWPRFDFLIDGLPGVPLDLPTELYSKIATEAALLDIAQFYGALSGYSMELRETTLHFFPRPEGGKPLEHTLQIPKSALAEKAIDDEWGETISTGGTLVDFQEHASFTLGDVPQESEAREHGEVRVFSGLIDWENPPAASVRAPEEEEDEKIASPFAMPGEPELPPEEVGSFHYVASWEDMGVVNRLLTSTKQIFVTSKLVEFLDDAEVGAQVLSTGESELLVAELASTDGIEMMAAPSIVTRSLQRASIEVIRELPRQTDAGHHDMDWVGTTIKISPRAFENTIRIDGSAELRKELSSGPNGNIGAARSTFSMALESGQSVVVPLVNPETSRVSIAAIITVDYIGPEGDRPFQD